MDANMNVMFKKYFFVELLTVAFVVAARKWTNFISNERLMAKNQIIYKFII